MAHHEDDSHLSPEQKKFKDYMQHGDDFFKIEIFRAAKSWYNRALTMNMDNDLVIKRINECEHLLKYERKVFTILGVVTTILVVAGILLF
jgi:hypothetical protein